MRTTDLPRCPEHQNLVRDLALGLLEGDRATSAERARHECVHCCAWWSSALSESAVAPIEASVDRGFHDLVLPARRQRARWRIVAAAAAVFAVIGMAGILSRTPATPEVAHSSPQLLSVLDFESGPVETVESTDVVGEPLFTSSLEDGTLDGWS